MFVGFTNYTWKQYCNTFKYLSFKLDYQYTNETFNTLVTLCCNSCFSAVLVSAFLFLTVNTDVSLFFFQLMIFIFRFATGLYPDFLGGGESILSCGFSGQTRPSQVRNKSIQKQCFYWLMVILKLPTHYPCVRAYISYLLLKSCILWCQIVKSWHHMLVCWFVESHLAFFFNLKDKVNKKKGQQHI